MRKFLLIILLSLLTLVIPVNAQSSRVSDLAKRLSRQADELSERAYTDFTSRDSNTRSDLDTMMLAQQLAGSANVFRRMVQDRRRDSELRDAASILVEMSRRFPSNGSASYLWRDAARTIDDIGREVSAGSGGHTAPPASAENIVGRVQWRGTVDDAVHLYIRNDTIEQRLVSGSPFPNGTFNFTSPLIGSERRLNYSVNKIKGSGSVEIIKKPSKENEWTLVVQIRSGSGTKEYEIEAVWYVEK